ncbi:hypothetical protein [Magnetospirillum sp. SS-4]|uniref:hypothetical protein n=1 Tax=Magnetospirillum sp. SS-4 TaxID=2681465 RepID=UPI001384E9C1|nr:hypothetical protein [Magnetospirillum sp. SS-4]CAA7614449.1 exported hypothetical protein [Magnetospirillum sp. SS-4]
MRLLRRLFLAAAVPLLGLAAFQNWGAVGPDPFAPGQDRRLARLMLQSNPHLIAHKLRHVRESGPFDVLIFGDNATLALGQAELASHGRVFSMAVPGSSLGGSASLAQSLAAAGALAPTLVVLVENFEHFTQQVQMLPLGQRWPDMARLLAGSFDDPRVPGRDWLRMAARLARQEATLWLLSLSPRTVAEHVSMVFAGLFPVFDPGDQLVWGRFKADGAAGPMTAARPGLPPVPADLPDQPQVLASFIAHDLHRLATLPGRPRVVVAELPLEPAAAAHFNAKARPAPMALRKAFVEACAREGLECALAPVLGTSGEPNDWTDYYHPPASAIAPYVDGLLRGKS